jgi:hypothetical protein
MREGQMAYWVQLKQRDGLIVAPFDGGGGPTPKVGQLVACPIGGRNIQATVARINQASGPVAGGQRADMVEAMEL